jgi:DNA polymerase III epsilon subunit-like protein
MYVVFDTETTGLAQFGKPPTDALQPKLVQLAAVLFNDNDTEIACLSTIVQPEGWVIPEQAFKVHGITTQRAVEQGISLRTTAELFGEFLDIADTVVAHNVHYDVLVMRHNVSLLGHTGDIFEGKTIHCTKNASTNILKIKKPNGGYKWPTLTEAHTYFFNADFSGAHSALEDTRACARVYQELKKFGAFHAA